MGLIGILRNIFNKNIECGDNLNDRIVYLHKKKYLHLNKNILVRDGSACVIVYKYRVTDTIFPGKHKLNEGILPETYAKAKIMYKRGRNYRRKKIRTDIYFVKTQEIPDFEFFSDEPFYIKSKDLGRVKGYLQGRCTLKIIDPGLLIKALIFEPGRVVDGSEFKDIGLWIGNKIKRLIEKNKLSIESMLSDITSVNQALNQYMEMELDNIGIFVSRIDLKGIDFSKKCQSKINDYINMHKKPVKLPKFHEKIASTENESNMVLVGAETKHGEVVDSNTMQNDYNSLKINKFVKCNKCGTDNVMTAHICTNCGNHLDD